MLARVRGVPLLVDLGPIATTDGEAVLDVASGTAAATLVGAPSPATPEHCGRHAAAAQPVARAEAKAAAGMVGAPAVTAAGCHIALLLDLNDPEAVPDDLLRAGDGVELLRSEFRCLDRPELFCLKLRAAIRAAVYGPLSVMLPMVSRAPGVAAVRDLLDSEARALGRRVPPSGSTVKTPGADLDTMPVDFASRCSDDLTRHLTAGARDAPGPLADLADSLDLAIRRLRRLAVETARQRRLPFLLRGDMAADRAELEALLAAG